MPHDNAMTEPRMAILSDNHNVLADDVRSFLIGKYTEALRRGDKGIAKSCLLAARHFSEDDHDVTEEIYLMAKADGDVNEASKCFAKIFNNLNRAIPLDSEAKALVLRGKMDSPIQTSSAHSETFVGQEIDHLLEDLQSKYLKRKTTLEFLNSFKTRSANTVPLSNNQSQANISASPRMRMLSIDSNRESSSRNDNRTSISGNLSFYHQLFDQMSDEIKRNIFRYKIEHCRDLEMKCHLMMLAITIFNDTITLYGSSLLNTLIELSSIYSMKRRAEEATRHKIQSLLILDALPLVLNITQLQDLQVDIDQLYKIILDFYSDYYLENVREFTNIHEFQEGMRKSIAARIIGVEQVHDASEELCENYVISSLKLLNQKIIEQMTDPLVKEKLEKLNSIVSDSSNYSTKFDDILDTCRLLQLDLDFIPDELLFEPNFVTRRDQTPSVRESQQQVVISKTVPPPPPKTRGRPRKLPKSDNFNSIPAQASVTVNPDDVAKKNLLDKTKEVKFVFHSIIQYMFISTSRYLKATRSRVIVNYDLDKFLAQIKTELSKGAVQRGVKATRSSQQQVSVDLVTSNKKMKLDDKITKLLSIAPNSRDSLLNSEKSKSMDQSVIMLLLQAHRCLEFLNSGYGAFSKLWDKFDADKEISSLHWYRRVKSDAMILLCNYEISKNMKEDLEQLKSSLEPTKLERGVSLPDLAAIRISLQLVACYIQLKDKDNLMRTFEGLFKRLNCCEILKQDYDNVLEEYMIQIYMDIDKDVRFLLFDSLSIMRFCVNILLKLHTLYLKNPNFINDTSIGHAIVMSQFDWPKESNLYYHCIDWIHKNKPKSSTPQTLSASTKFTYPEFFKYIKNPNIIEDFMAMLNQGYTLDIKGTSAPNTASSSQSSTTGTTTASTRSNKMVTTRGVNKTFKEDLKVAQVSQMRDSSILLPLDLIMEFMQLCLVPFVQISKR